MTHLVTDQDRASLSGPRDMKTPGDLDWCWQTISALQSMWKSLDLDFERYQRVWQEAEEHRVWEQIPPGTPYGSKEAFLDALGVGDEEAARARVATTSFRVAPLKRHGQRGKRRADQQVFSKKKLGSMSADYLTGRIARDRPDVWERMKAGEFKSVAAAARAAGIPYKVPKRINLSDPASVAAAIRRYFSEEQVQQLIRALQE